MVPLEEAANLLEQTFAPLSHLHAVHNTLDIRKAYETCLPLLTEHHSAIQQHQGLYHAIRSIDQTGLSSSQIKVIQDALVDFELAGIHLPKAHQTRLAEIEKKLSSLSTTFENHLLDAIDAFAFEVTQDEQLSGLPKHLIDAARKKAIEKNKSGWLFGIDSPTYLTVMTFADNQALRKILHEAYVTRASELGPQAGQFDNGPVMNEILTLQHELATLLGYEHFAALSLKKKMAESVAKVTDFLSGILARAKAKAEEEYNDLQTFAKHHCQLDTLHPWDIAYVSEKQKQQRFSIDEEALRPYFTEHAVWEGIRFIIATLYGLRLELIPLQDTWHESVSCFALIDETNTLRGYLYADLYARPYKRSGAWMDVLQTGYKKADGSRQIPIATLTCNFTQPVTGKVGTLLHEEVVTLLHELGHCLHHLLSQVDEYSLSGIHGVEWDAVELPSQLFEHWAWEPIALERLTAHEANHSTLPLELIQGLKKTQAFQSGLAIIRQIEFALFDMAIHQAPPASSDWIQEQLNAIREKTKILPLAPNNRFQHSFSHIFAGGYAAGYYSYLWAEVLSSDVFSEFETQGIFDQATGRRLMTTILEQGSRSPAQKLFHTFMQREPKIDAFLRHRDLMTHNHSQKLPTMPEH